MTKEEIVNTLYHLFKDELKLQTMDAFSLQARLNEDLAVDSILFLELLLLLEVDLGMNIPDERIFAKDFYTVESLADFLYQHQSHLLMEEGKDD